MRTSVWLMMTVVTLLLLLVSCGSPQDTLQSKHLEPNKENSPNVTNPPIQPPASNQTVCGSAPCAKDQVCVNQKCQCLEGFKSCAGSCIPQTNCCADKDCLSTETCVANKCQFTCSRVICPKAPWSSCSRTWDLHRTLAAR